MKYIHIKPLKVGINLLIISFLFACFALLTINILFKNEINMVVSSLNPVSNNNEVIEENAIMKVVGDDSKLVQNYPQYGQAYGNIKIPSVNLDLPVYYGDSSDILKNGIGHMIKGCLPGEGSSIVLGGLNSNVKFGKLKDLKLNDKIEINTSYGKFSYIIYDLKVITGTSEDLVSVKKDNEVLMLYTNYPFEYLGKTNKRYVVYANLSYYEIYEVK